MRVFDRAARALLGASITLVASAFPLMAQQGQDAESRMRAALRNATIQIRQLEDENARLQAKQAQSERNAQELSQKVAVDEELIEQLREQATKSQDAADQLTAKLKSVATAFEDERSAFMKLRTAYEQAGAAAHARDEEANRLDATLIGTRKHLLDCRDKNMALYTIGSHVLDLYDKKGLLSMLIDGEPVTGLKRVELENLVQDYKDKMLDNVYAPSPITPEQSPTTGR